MEATEQQRSMLRVFKALPVDPDEFSNSARLFSRLTYSVDGPNSDLS